MGHEEWAGVGLDPCFVWTVGQELGLAVGAFFALSLLLGTAFSRGIYYGSRCTCTFGFLLSIFFIYALPYLIPRLPLPGTEYTNFCVSHNLPPHDGLLASGAIELLVSNVGAHIRILVGWFSRKDLVPVYHMRFENDITSVPKHVYGRQVIWK